MAKNVPDTQLEETQAALHEGFEKARALIEEYEKRIRPQPIVEEVKPPKPTR